MLLSSEQIRSYFEVRHPGQPIPSREKVAVRCVFHPDKNASCTLFLDGNGGFYCHGCGAKGNIFQFEMRISNCSIDEAVQRVAQLTGARIDSSDSQGQCTAVYDYRLADGTICFQKRCYQSPEGREKFAIFTPDGKHGRLAGLDKAQKARTVLYNLPALVTATLVLLPECEKDCDTLISLNLFSDTPHIRVAATTNCEGAWKQGDSPKWLDSYSPYFAGKHVVIFEDNDDPSRTWANYVATEVFKYAHSVRLISLPEKGDVSDWLLGHNEEEMRKLITSAPVWTPPGAAAQSTKTPEDAARITGELLEKCRVWIRRFVVLGDDEVTILVCWLLHTWAFNAAVVTPYLHVHSPEKGSGKTTLMRVLKALARGPRFSSGISAAALARVVAKDKPTLFIDELDALMKGDREKAQDIRGVLDGGFDVSGTYTRCVGNDFEVKDFPTFCPKVLGGIGELWDTVSSRSISVEMRRRLPSENVEGFRQRRVEKDAIPMREALQAWASGDVVELLEQIEVTEVPGLADRQMDMSEPLLQIAQLAGDGWLRHLTSALLAVFRAHGAEGASTGVTLLQDIRDVFAERKTDKIPSKDLVECLCQIEGRPWAEWSHGKGMTPNTLAQQLKRFGICPIGIRIGESSPKGYRRCDFEDAWARYCPPLPAQTATPPQPPSLLAETSYSNRNTQPPVAVLESASNPREQRLVAGVAVQDGETANMELRI